MIWKPGQQIQEGKYVIEAVLGIGGFGVTYRAKDNYSEKLVAIKTVNDLVQTKPDFPKHQQKFVQEAFRLAKCNHKHIVGIDDVCQEGELWCLVMEYLTGGNLDQYVSHYGLLSETEALIYIKQIAEALIYVHQQSFLHRDVKPANIMLRGNNGEGVLIDFGLAREFISGKTLTHTNARSESFSPIEQYQTRAKRGPWTDVYALAATCYYLVTGVQPLPAQFRWQGASLIPPQKHIPSLSNDLNSAIVEGMTLEPESRPQSIAEWLELLKPCHQQSGLLVFPSAKGYDYQTLRDLLAAQEWCKADEETYEALLKIAHREKEGWLDYKSTCELPCKDLQTIDRLWTEYSNGHFGFSVQKKIWQRVSGKIDYGTECLLGESLGWRVQSRWLAHDSLTFSLNAPLGHLPWNGHLPNGELKELGLAGSYARWWCCLILSRCNECNI
jgi:serine/threonine protein kinase